MGDVPGFRLWHRGDALGHAHPHLVAALTAQAKSSGTAPISTRSAAGTAAERLVAASFADTVFFCNSGAEAIEGGSRSRANITPISAIPKVPHHLLHRRVPWPHAGDLAAGGNEKHLPASGRRSPGFDHVPYDDLRDARGDQPETAAILVEPVQGEGGLARPARISERTARVCDQYGLLLLIDEVQCGMGRTGKLFAHEWAGISPTSWRRQRVGRRISRGRRAGDRAAARG